MRLKAADLVPGTAYAAQVRAVRDGETSEFSERFLFTTDLNLTTPSAPLGVAWTVVGDAFSATWNEVTTDINGGVAYIDSYELELASGTGGTKTVIVPAPSGASGNWTLTFANNYALFGTPQPQITLRVRAVNSRNVKGVFSGGVLAQNPVPGNVTGFTATGTQDAIGLAWTANTDDDLDHYEVFTGATAGFTPAAGNRIFAGSTTRFTYVTTTYSLQYFKIRAVDRFGQISATDASASATPTSPFVVDVTAPATPTALSATITNNGTGVGAKAAVTWTMTSPPSDLAGFNLRFRAVSTTNYQYMTGIDSADRAAQVILDLAFTNYEFQIQAYDFTDNKSAWSSTYTATSPSNATPAVPSGLTSVADANSITYSWTGVADTDIKNYEVTFSTSPTFASGNITYLTGTSTTLNVGGLAPSTTYYARVRANDNGGLSSAFTATDTRATSGPASASDGLAPQSSPTPNVLSGLSYLYLTWTPVILNSSGGTQTDAVTYEVHLSTTTGFTPSSGTKVTEVMGSSAVIDVLPGTTTPLSYGTTYFIKLIAKDRDGAAAAGSQGSGTVSKVASTDVTSIGADLIVPGTGFVQALVVNSGGSIQSSNYVSLTTGWKISPTGIEMNDTGSKIKVDALQAGTIGGSGGAGAIQVAAGTSINMNGGYLKSNTYTGTSAASNPSGAGFYLGNDGLRIDQGTISAAAFSGGSYTTGTITLSGGSITGGGWTLNSSGLSIPNGGISAAALNIQTGANLMPPAYADFELNTSFYSTVAPITLTVTNAAAAVVTTQFRFNAQSLSYSPSNTTNSVFLGRTNTDYNIVVQPSTSYIVSYYAMVVTGGTAATLTPSLKYATSTTPGTVNGTGAALPANSTWVRYSSVIAVPATATGQAILSFSTNTAAGTVFIDGIQVEQQLSNATAPSTWNPPGATSIAGDMIRTGSLISSTTTTVNSTTIPYWNINANGAASFASLQIRGSAVMGVLGTDDGGASQMASGNYVAGSIGWMIRSDGVSEFRQMAADSINGLAIRANTLTVDSLSGGTLTGQVALGAGTALVATGSMGETVSLGDYGFQVLGAQINTVTFKASSGLSRTLTTAVPHNFFATAGTVLGSKILVNVGDADYDTPVAVYVDTVPTTTTFTYTMPTSVTASTTAVTNGTVQGANKDLVANSPTYIDFPTDGTQPNIISGQLTASNVTVTDGMSIRKASQIEQGAVLTINSVIQPPAIKPSGSSAYNSTVFGSAGSPTVWDMTHIPGGNYFQVRGYPTQYNVTEYTANGTFVADRVSYGPAIIDRHPYSLVYGNIAGGRYYLGYYVTTDTQYIHRVEVYDTSWVYQGFYSLATGSLSTDPMNGAKLGWDYTNNRLMAAFINSSFQSVFRHYTMNTSTGFPTGVASDVVSSALGFSATGFVARGDFDYGTGADVIVRADTKITNGVGQRMFYVCSNTGTYDIYKYWPTANNAIVNGGFWDTGTSKFYGFNAGSRILYTYEGGDSMWTTPRGGNELLGTRWVGYSWYRSIATISESTVSPRASFSFAKRARMQITIPTIPTGGSTTTPDAARIYIAETNTDAFPTNYLLRAQVMAPSTSANIDPYASLGSTTPHLTNDFAGLTGVPGQIISATGNSFWKGDDTAQFYQLILNSNADANYTAGNKPALRIGVITAQHLRIDNNEIIAMNDDSTTGTLSLNQGGIAQVGTLNFLTAGKITSNDSNVDFFTNNGVVRIAGGSNIAGKLSTNFASATGAAMVLESSRITMGTQAYNATSPTASNTVQLNAADIHSWTGGFTDEALAGPSATTAQIGAGGRIVRATLGSYTTSSRDLKANIEDMTFEQARAVLSLRPRTYEDKENMGERLPGLIVEEVEESIGGDLWVGYDINGKAAGVRYQQLPVAHTLLIRDHDERIQILESRILELEAQLGLGS